MRAICFEAHGNVDKLHLTEMDEPTLGPHDVLIRVRAASLNGFDPMILHGTTELKTPMPMIPGGDMAGEIVALGERAHERDPRTPPFLGLFDPARWKVGDRVCPFPFVPGEGMTGETRRGSCCEYMAFPAMNLMPIPDDVSYEQAACVPIAYGTAYRLMCVVGKVRAREKVLILGATGGLGSCAVQLAKAAGAMVIATGRGAAKLEKLKALGVDHVIDTGSEDFVAACHQICGKPRMMSYDRGVDFVVNYIGGETWSQCQRVMKHGARMYTCGASAGFEAHTDLRYLWTYEHKLIGSNGWFPGDQLNLLAMVARGEITPLIDSVHPLEGTPKAMQKLIDREVFGKVVIQA